MNTRVFVAAVLMVPLFACSGQQNGAGILPASSARSVQPQNGAMAMPGGGGVVCTGSVQLGDVQCTALVNTTVGFLDNSLASAGIIRGLHPADIRAAYNLSSDTAGSGSTIAVIDKGDDPNAESDLAVYRRAFGLPACTSRNGCFRKVNARGQSGEWAFPPGDQQWSQEIALDLDMVSAVCPNCRILLVEANAENIQSLGAAVDTAAALGATEISNSYYTQEYSGIVNADRHFDHPGIPITASAGDTGYGVTFPASSEYVTAVGGTSLVRAPGTPRGWAETVWGSTGSGCSADIAKPVWQTDTGCTMRTVADMAVLADPATGVSVYNSYAVFGQRGWGVYGGTSVGAPVVAAIYALAGNGTSIDGARYAYAHAASFNPVLAGVNGVCSPSYLCAAGPGYNGPAGLGTPNGVAGF
ncbi:MAG TPA: hypothetical protein VIN40_04595 [Candidatus Tyrphobacter sp.]